MQTAVPTHPSESVVPSCITTSARQTDRHPAHTRPRSPECRAQLGTGATLNMKNIMVATAKTMSSSSRTQPAVTWLRRFLRRAPPPLLSSPAAVSLSWARGRGGARELEENMPFSSCRRRERVLRYPCRGYASSHVTHKLHNLHKPMHPSIHPSATHTCACVRGTLHSESTEKRLHPIPSREATAKVRPAARYCVEESQHSTADKQPRHQEGGSAPHLLLTGSPGANSEGKMRCSRRLTRGRDRLVYLCWSSTRPVTATRSAVATLCLPGVII